MARCNLDDLKNVNWQNYCQEYSAGLDYLRFSFYEKVPFLDGIINQLYGKTTNKMIENSNVYGQEIKNDVFTWVSEYSKTGIAIKCSIQYNGQSFPIFYYEIFSSGLKTSTYIYSRLDVYGSFWALMDKNVFPEDFIDTFLSSLGYKGKSIGITRVDYRVDMFSNEKILFTDEDAFPNLDDRTDIDRKGKRAEEECNWAIGKKQIGRYFVRYYDKLKDINRSFKVFLYSEDYMQWFNVFRLEVQFNRKYCQGIEYKIGDLTRCLKGENSSDISSFVFFYSHIRGIFGLSNYRYHKLHLTTPSKLVNQYNKSQLSKLLVGYFKKFVQSDQNPLILLHESIQSSNERELVHKYDDQLEDFLLYLQSNEKFKSKHSLLKAKSSLSLP